MFRKRFGFISHVTTCKTFAKCSTSEHFKNVLKHFQKCFETFAALLRTA